jgi:hypothetical protein
MDPLRVKRGDEALWILTRRLRSPGREHVIAIRIDPSEKGPRSAVTIATVVVPLP